MHGYHLRAALPPGEGVVVNPTTGDVRTMPTMTAFVDATIGRTWVRAVLLSVAAGVSLWSFDRVPHATWLPALVGLLPWAVGKYVLCPLRWHALSVSGRSRRWHLRVYAESELLGLLSPAHAGADLWRMHKLQSTGMQRTSALAEVGLDRMIGASGLTLFVLGAGATLPRPVLAASIGIAVGCIALALLVRRFRPGLLAERPLPRPAVALQGIVLSMGYQLTILGLFMGTTAAMGQEVQPLQLL